MVAIRAKNTNPEILVRKFLWSYGFRYRINHRRLLGKPDIVIRRLGVCFFIDGCFWHGYTLFRSVATSMNEMLELLQ